MNCFLRCLAPAAMAAAGALAAQPASLAAASPPNAYVVTSLVSDQPGAPNHDKNLKNAWGTAFSPAGSPFWISDNAAGKSTLYDGKGTIVPLVVKIACPPKTGQGSGCPKTAAPTGIVWNPSSAFLVPGTALPAAFIWATEDGTISAWSGMLANPANSVLAVDNSTEPNATSGAVYKGLAFGVNESGAFLFATNFRAGTIDVFAPAQDKNGNGLPYMQQKLSSGAFTDPKIGPGFAPFGIQNIDGNLIVTYAKQNAAKHDDTGVDGFVDAYDTDGHLLQRLASHGGLMSPWGVVRASYAFGPFGGDLLIGNFGNGWINALTSINHLVPLNGTNGAPLAIDGLWNLGSGGGRNSNPSALYYSAGPNGETDGRFGTITPGNASSPGDPWN